MSKKHRQTGSEQLRHYLKSTRTTQSALAAELGISDSHISEVLSGQASPSMVLADRIENLTGIPMRAFVRVA